MVLSFKGSGQVELGFLVSPEENWAIWDSAKFGGKPWWLIPNQIPSAKDVTCKCCGKVMCFLMQLYNPCDDRRDLYHRCIYVFVCRTQECLEKGSQLFLWCITPRMKVLRCQLPQQNNFYPENIDDGFISNYFDPESKCSPFHYGIHLCSVCGLKATSKCSKCDVYYCCRDHQVAAWSFDHKEYCGKGNQSLSVLYDDSKVYPRVQFPLWEVDIFPEPEPTKEELESEEAERKRLNAFKVAEGPVGRYLFVFFMCRYH